MFATGFHRTILKKKKVNRMSTFHLSQALEESEYLTVAPPSNKVGQAQQQSIVK